LTGLSTTGIGGLFEINPATTNTTAEIFRVRRLTSSTAAANIGGAMDWYIEDASGNNNLAGRIANILTTATHGSEVSALAFWVDNLGVGIAEVMRIQGDVGFIWNDAGSSVLDFRVESDTYNAINIDASADSIVIMSNTAGKIGFWGHAAAAQPAAYTPTNVTPDRSYDANSTTLDEIADVLGTLIADLQTLGVVA
jgi:hypothetical protein